MDIKVVKKGTKAAWGARCDTCKTWTHESFTANRVADRAMFRMVPDFDRELSSPGRYTCDDCTEEKDGGQD